MIVLYVHERPEFIGGIHSKIAILRGCCCHVSRIFSINHILQRTPVSLFYPYSHVSTAQPPGSSGIMRSVVLIVRIDDKGVRWVSEMD